MNFYFHLQYYYCCFSQKKYLIFWCSICGFRNYRSPECSITFKNPLMDCSLVFTWFAVFVKMTSCNFDLNQCTQVFMGRGWMCISPFLSAKDILLVLFIYSLNVLFVTHFACTEFHGFFCGFVVKVSLNFFLLFAKFYYLMFLSL